MSFPGYEALRAERTESGPRVLLRITDDAGEVIRRVAVPAVEGVHRVSWDLRRPAPDPVSFADPSFRPPWVTDPQGPLAPPGDYAAQLVVVHDGQVTEVGGPRAFPVRPAPFLPDGVDYGAVAAHHARVADLRRKISIAGAEMSRAAERIRYMRAALERTPDADPGLFAALDRLEARLAEFRLRLTGDPVRSSLSQSTAPSLSSRASGAAAWGTTQPPTGTQRENLRMAEGDFATLEGEVAGFLERTLVRVENALADAGAPWTPGRRVGSGR